MIIAGSNDLPEVVELKFDHVFFTGKDKVGYKSILIRY